MTAAGSTELKLRCLVAAVLILKVDDRLLGIYLNIILMNYH